MGETSPGSGQCTGALSGEDIGFGGKVWLIGDKYDYYALSYRFNNADINNSFMQNVYTVFSFDQNAVGFATLAQVWRLGSVLFVPTLWYGTLSFPKHIQVWVGIKTISADTYEGQNHV